MKRLLVMTYAAVATFAALADGETWQSRAPMQDTYVDSAAMGTANGSSGGIIVGNGREGCMMFDVSGLANVTAAKIKFYITQCGKTEGVKWPLYFCVMRNDRWNETTLTWNSLPDEFRTAPAAILSTNDASVAGYVEVPAGSGNSWQEVDVTEAVKAAAPQGRLALHVCTSWDSSSGDTTPLAFASSDRADETLRPTLEFTGAVDASSSSLTLLPVADTFIYRNDANQNYGSNHLVLAQDGNREGFLRFDLSGIAASSVDSAVFLVRTYSGGGQPNHESGGTVQCTIPRI